MAIGERIKARREELGLSQQQLADRLGYKSKARDGNKRDSIIVHSNL